MTDIAVPTDVQALAAWIPQAPPNEVSATRNQLVDVEGYIKRNLPTRLLEVRRAARVTEWHMASRWPANPDGAHRDDDRPSLGSDGASRQEWQRIYWVGREQLDWLLDERRTAAELTQAQVIDHVRRTLRPWSDEERDLQRRLKAGETVVVSMREDRHICLIAWAEDAERYVQIDRRSPWGNPFEIPADGDRATVIRNYAQHYLPHKPLLLAQVKGLVGKALGCWCAPEPCHGDVLKAMAEAFEVLDPS